MYVLAVPMVGSMTLLHGAMVVYLLAIIGIGLFISSLSSTQQQAIIGTFMFLAPAIMAGLLPILWCTGTGSEVVSRIDVPMIGGMVSSTVLTLAAIPAIYAAAKEWTCFGSNQCLASLPGRSLRRKLPDANCGLQDRHLASPKVHSPESPTKYFATMPIRGETTIALSSSQRGWESST